MYNLICYTIFYDFPVTVSSTIFISFITNGSILISNLIVQYTFTYLYLELLWNHYILTLHFVLLLFIFECFYYFPTEITVIVEFQYHALIQHNIKSYHISNIYIIYYVIELMIWQKAINYQALISFSHLFPNRLFVRQLTNLKSKIINLKSIIHFLFYISVEKVQLRVFFHCIKVTRYKWLIMKAIGVQFNKL